MSAPFWILARLSTPDALALLIVMSGMYVLLEWRRPGLALAILLVAVLARPNAVVAVLAISAVAALARPEPGSASRGRGPRWPLWPAWPCTSA